MVSPEKSLWFTSGMAVVAFVGLALEVLDVHSPVLAAVFFALALLFVAWAVLSYQASKKRFNYNIHSQFSGDGGTGGEVSVRATFSSDRKFRYLNITLAELIGVDNSLRIGETLMRVVRNIKPGTLRSIPMFHFRPSINELEVVASSGVLKRSIKRDTNYFFSIVLATGIFRYKKVSFFMKVDKDGYIDVNPTEVLEE